MRRVQLPGQGLNPDEWTASYYLGEYELEVAILLYWIGIRGHKLVSLPTRMK
jgi:hypothetical protein